MRIIAEPHLGLAMLGEDAVRLDRRTYNDRGIVAGAHLHRLLAQSRQDHGIAVGSEVAVVTARLTDANAGGAHRVDERAIVERLGDAGMRGVALLVRSPLRIDLVRR